MDVWTVTPAFRRFEVTRLALAQRAHLRGELAGRGINMFCVVVADDENLDIAREHGFETLERENLLGAKINAGIVFACEQGADWVCWAGSDDWLHADLFLPILDWDVRAPVISGRLIAIVDMERARLRRLHVGSNVGAPPWLIPRWALEGSSSGPVESARMRGLDGSLARGLGGAPDWVFHDPHDLARVDFKTSENISAYEGLSRSLGYGDEVSPWDALVERYPSHLVEMARLTHEQLATVAA